MEFDFRKMLKNKYFLIGLVLTVLIFISVALSGLSSVFFVVTCFLAAALCALLVVYYFMKFKEAKSDNRLDLVPLTKEEKDSVLRSKRFGNMYNILKVILFAFATVAFIVFGIKLI